MSASAKLLNRCFNAVADAWSAGEANWAYDDGHSVLVLEWNKHQDPKKLKTFVESKGVSLAVRGFKRST